MVDTSDLMIAFCPTNIYSVGMVHEIVLARQQKKPVLFVTPPIELPALQALREHIADDDRGLELKRRALIDVHIEPSVAQQDSSGKTANRTADHGHPPHAADQVSRPVAS